MSSLYAELAAKFSRVAELEVRISALETENAIQAVARRESTGNTGKEEDPISHQLAEHLCGIEHWAVEKPGWGVTRRDAIEVSDDDEGAAAVGANKGESPDEGVGAVPALRKRVVARESVGEADAEDVEGGGGNNRESSVGLEDDYVSVTPRGKKRGRRSAVAQVVTSDSEDDGVNGGGGVVKLLDPSPSHGLVPVSLPCQWIRAASLLLTMIPE
uniref:Uncharacterized protein n=1 Tax=Zea mays TaxID=4577 RepID=A0A804PST9_MAIZE